MARGAEQMAHSWWSAAGLAIDFVGVALLGIDLIRLQAALRRQAGNNRATLDGLASDYGGTESWAAEIEKSAKWYPSSSYSDYHAEDEISFNARRVVEQLGEMASVANGLAGHLARVTTYLDEAARESEQSAGASFWFSIVGMTFIALGFAVQLKGSWPT
jgi:hypothetical protein